MNRLGKWYRPICKGLREGAVPIFIGETGELKSNSVMIEGKLAEIGTRHLTNIRLQCNSYISLIDVYSQSYLCSVMCL
jgi:hypothetical protein